MTELTVRELDESRATVDDFSSSNAKDERENLFDVNSNDAAARLTIFLPSIENAIQLIGISLNLGFCTADTANRSDRVYRVS